MTTTIDDWTIDQDRCGATSPQGIHTSILSQCACGLVGYETDDPRDRAGIAELVALGLLAEGDVDVRVVACHCGSPCCELCYDGDTESCAHCGE